MNVIYASKLEEGAKLPTRKHWNDAGMDLYALDDNELDSQTSGIIRTGVTVGVPDGYVGIIKAKGKSDFIVGAGVVDAGYQGELLVKIFNPYKESIKINAGSAIAQMLLVPCVAGEIVEVDREKLHTSVSSRGTTGGIVEQLSFFTEFLTEDEAKQFMENNNDTK
jgi:dUTP pyrophosphatase